MYKVNMTGQLNKSENQMGRVRFVSRVSNMGDRKIILIPKEYHGVIEKLQGKQVRVVVDDEF